ncbi:MAG: hypothetical protein ACT4PQ_13650 [Betaproteobacteria bacterium]
MNAHANNLDTIAPVFRVADLARPLSYYRDQLGFEFEAAEHPDASFGVRDAQALASRFANAGAGFSVPLRTMPYGKEFCVRDPDGYILGFIRAGEAQAR